MKENIRARFADLDYIATTADCWSKGKRSFIGITAHWINKETLQPEYAALACHRVKDQHTYKRDAPSLFGL